MASNTLAHSVEEQINGVFGIVKRLPLAFWRNALFAIALLWMTYNLARVFWLLIPTPEIETPAKIATPVVSSSQSIQTRSVDLAAMQSRQIFGQSLAVEPEPPTIDEPAEENVEKTRLNLKLVGLLSSSDAKSSSATIANGSNQEIYRISEKLPVGNNVTLAKVLSDRVILNNNGNYEALWLYSEADFNVRRTTSTRSAAVSQSRNVQEEDDGDEGRNVQQIQTSVTQDQIPESISDVVRFSVHREEGQMIGFRIRPGKNRDLFDQLGLQANDVVTSVNGIAIDNPQAIRDNYQQLKSATQADLEIKRGEERVYVNVSLDTLSE